MKKRAILATILFLSIALCILGSIVIATSARIWTDKADYSPEETVTIFGSGFVANAAITGTVTRPNGVVDSWTATSDSAGNFVATYLLDGITGTYLVTATDGTNTETTTFTDTVGIGGVVSSDSGGTAKYSFLTSEDVYCKITTTGSGGSRTVRIYVVNSIPANKDTLTDHSSDGYETVAVTGDTTQKIWSAPTSPGTYYVVVDDTPYGEYNSNEKVSASFTIADNTPPDTSITAGPTGWINVQSATFSWTGSDDVTATANLVYSWRLDGGAWSAYSSATTTTLTGLAEGSHTFDVRAKDEAGNVDPTPATRSFSVDTVKPTSSVNALPTYETSRSFMISYAVNDPAPSSGVASVHLWYKAPGGVWTDYGAFTSGGTFTATQDGAYEFYAIASDNAGNVESAPVSADASTTVDTTKPVSSVGSLPTYETSLTFNVPFTASDTGGSGVNYVELYYRKDGGSWTKYGTTFTSTPISFTASADGFYEFYTRATDNAGNVEDAPASADASTTVDTVAPTVVISVSDSLISEADAGSTFTVTATFSEAMDKAVIPTVGFTPGVSTTLASPGGSWNVAGTVYSFTFTVADANVEVTGVDVSVSGGKDLAGNLQSPNPTTAADKFSIDTVAPSVSITSPADNAWVTTATPTISGTSSDSGSGVAKVEVSVDGGAYSLATGTTSWSFTTGSLGEGGHSVTARATDVAGNHQTDSITVKVDTVAPVTSDDYDGLWHTSDFTITLSASDSTSGVATTYYKINGGATKTVSGDGQPQITIESATNSLEYWSVDVAGNVEGHHTLLTIKLDKTAPTIVITGFEDYGVYPKGTVWSFSATDATSGLASCTGSVIDTNGESYAVSSGQTLEAGVYTLTVTAIDNAGNVATLQRFFVVYDPSAGFVTGGGWINSPAGAYVANPLLTGKATFGFVSKYQKGAKVPTGNTEFQFHAADFNFKSTSYQWLVVSGKRAQFKGTGTINGAGNYGFMLTVIDGGTKGTDYFRIKIWDINNHDAIIYDSGLGTDDTGDPTIPLAGGSIVIQAK